MGPNVVAAGGEPAGPGAPDSARRRCLWEQELRPGQRGQLRAWRLQANQREWVRLEKMGVQEAKEGALGEVGKAQTL